MFSPVFSPTNSHGCGYSGRTLYVVGSQEIYAWKIRRFFNRRELFDVQYQVMAFGLLVNIDRSDLLRVSAGIRGCLAEQL
jgi:hypothetical protein